MRSKSQHCIAARSYHARFDGNARRTNSNGDKPLLAKQCDAQRLIKGDANKAVTHAPPSYREEASDDAGRNMSAGENVEDTAEAESKKQETACRYLGPIATRRAKKRSDRRAKIRNMRGGEAERLAQGRKFWFESDTATTV